jgi:hypothetical protein
LNESIIPLEDGMLVLRYEFGSRDSELTDKVVGVGCRRCDPAAIAAYLASLGGSLDIDANGQTDPLRDGVLVLRYLFGLRGPALVFEAVASDCNRCFAGEIESWLQGLTNS